ncbi:ECF transporter S component [Oscillibacter ruminantium]|uniref:ECF transporter S component n=1 Tax=Oscillibacter ruminantium TaxID=1263547 RepID=UPI00332A4606
MKQTTIKKHIQRLVLAAMFLALGIVLPFLTGQIPQVGSMLLPMHLPVLLCGLICGWQYGGAVGLVLPLLRYVMFGMPPIFPTGIAMTFELAAYGAIAGFLYNRSKWQCVFALYRSLLIAMAGGRIIWGVVRVLLTGVAGEAFTWQMFMAGAFLNAIPGIVLQLVFIPVLMVALDRTGMVRFSHSHTQIAEN